MLKRFYSKRSGFTLAEIIVAFAVFAIMSTMVAQVLQLAVFARNSNNAYAQELADQEHMLTLIEKNSGNYTGTGIGGTLSFSFDDGTMFDLAYETKPSNPAAENAAEGINYFLSPVNYMAAGETSPGAAGGADVGGVSQAARYDTRITGTGGIGNVTVYRVIKDTHTYNDPTSPLYLAPGNTRYLIEVAASSVDDNGKVTLLDEDVPYSQYRLLFYKDTLNAAASAVEYTDEASGKTYTKDVYEAARILKVGYLSTTVTSAASSGLSTSNTTSAPNNNNIYTIEQQSANCIRIGSPFETNNANGVNTPLGKMGVRFNGGSFSRFYVDFEGDPNLTTASFGYNGVSENNADGSTRTVYTAFPVYEDTYNADGTPTYDDTGKTHVNIYGASIYTRHYK